MLYNLYIMLDKPKKQFVVFTGPSGVGKATIENELFKDESLKLSLSVSATTRSPRQGEIDGVHYYFLSHEAFDELIKDDQFIEWNAHFSNKYGTLKSEVEKISQKGYHAFLEIEVMGAKKVIEKFGKDNVLSIFIAPPSIETLRERIKIRGSESEKQLEERLARVEEEMSYQDIFDYVVYNDDLSQAVTEIKSILKKEL